MTNAGGERLLEYYRCSEDIKSIPKNDALMSERRVVQKTVSQVILDERYNFQDIIDNYDIFMYIVYIKRKETV